MKEINRDERNDKMTKTKKPTYTPSQPFPSVADALHQEDNWLWIPLRNEWRDVSQKPEEIVRQKFIRTLVEHYGYALEQMDQERRTQHGHKSPRADIVVWQTAAEKEAGRTPVLVAECKTDTIEIQERDYYQGESYARATGCAFFIATNARHTAVFKLVPGLPGEFVAINEIPKATDWNHDTRLKEISESLRTFNRKEFQDLLFACHNILRDTHKMDPGRAFDTISKILFIKMYVERSGQHGTFSIDYLGQRAKVQLPTDPAVHDGLFEQTKTYYNADNIFEQNDKLNISEETFRRIVKQLERFDLSKTGDDIKGLAFEKFLGTTFRGELGQFFTPRPIVDFMVDLLDPKEGELICDPAAGSGGFLIRAFEHVRAQIVADIQRQKDEERARIEALRLSEEDEEREIEAAFARLNNELLPSDDNNKPINTRVGRLAWQCIYGTDAEPRAARTAKMNMIMHGDGHGGIHHHDGLVDINGIFEGRFDVVLTNPPFGSNVGVDQKVGGSDETRVPNDEAYLTRCRERGYGPDWEKSHQRLLHAVEAKTPILELFEIGKGKNNRPTELLFLERCIRLLKPGGRMGIVLPDGTLNNPSLSWLRRWAEGKAKLLAVVSLPEETFRSSNATVKTSIVFLRKFTEAEAQHWEDVWTQAHAEVDGGFNEKRNDLHARYAPRIVCGEDADAERLLDDLAALGIRRVLPQWQSGEAPAYPRQAKPTIQGKPLWRGEAAKEHKKMVSELKKRAAAQLATVQRRSEALLSELKAAYRAIDEAHTAALWARVRELFDYPVFVAAPKAVGITSTGETGEQVDNDLPRVLLAFREFETWVKNGAQPEATPNFLVPLHCVIRQWRGIERWIEHGTGPHKISRFKILPLSDLVVPSRKPVCVDGVLGDWQAITIRSSGEVLPRDRIEAFKGVMFAAYPGDLVFSKLGVGNGAVGLIPDSIPKAVVTSEYPVFTPKEDKLRSSYLHHLLRIDHFKAELQRKASGSGRKRVTPEAFLSLEIPVPTLDEQDTLLAAYTDALARAAQLEQEAETIERAGWQAFETALGITPSPPLPDRPVFLAWFKNVERWSHEGILRSLDRTPTTSGSVSMIPLGQLAKVSYGIQKCPANRPAVHARPYLRVANVQRGVLDLREMKYINVPDEEMSKLRLEVGDVLLCEGNSPDLVGRGAIWRGEIEDCVHQNHVLRVRVDGKKLLPDFVLAIINSSHGQAYFRSKAKRTTNLASINSKEVAGLPVPALSIDRQQDVLDALHAQVQAAQTKRLEAAALRQSAWAAFEAALFTAAEGTDA